MKYPSWLQWMLGIDRVRISPSVTRRNEVIVSLLSSFLKWRYPEKWWTILETARSTRPGNRSCAIESTDTHHLAVWLAMHYCIMLLSLPAMDTWRIVRALPMSGSLQVALIHVSFCLNAIHLPYHLNDLFSVLLRRIFDNTKVLRETRRRKMF